MTSSPFGHIITGDDIHKSAVATIGTWVDTYIAEMERQKNVALPAIRSFGSGVDPSGPVDNLPACVVVAPGMTSEPQMRGDGEIDAWWALGVGIVVADIHFDTANMIAHLYTGMLRTLLLQQRALGGIAEELRLESEDVAQLAWNTDHVVFAGRLEFAVWVRGITNRQMGFLTPPVDPAHVSPFPAVATTGITITTKQ